MSTTLPPIGKPYVTAPIEQKAVLNDTPADGIQENARVKV